MGTEFAQSSEWNHDSQLDWWLLQFDKHKGMQALVKDLNNFYKEEKLLWKNDYNPEGFKWLDVNDADHSVFAMLRTLPDEEGEIIAVSNFTPVPYVGYRLGVPRPGVYKIVLNTDDKKY